MPDTSLPSPAATAALLRNRRTIHLFQPETPPETEVRRALDLARWAPNHRRTEPWRFYLLGRETAAALAALNAELVTQKSGPKVGAAKLVRWKAVPGWLVVTCTRHPDPLRAEEDYAACCCAIQNAMLYLWSAGIGAKWTTGAVTREPRFFEILGIDPAAERLVGLLWYGYPAKTPAMERQPLDAVLQTRR